MQKEKYGVIYMIRNKVNNKIYFGQTIENNGFDRRYKNDIVKHTHNEHLKRSISKYGIDNFEIDKEFDIAYSKEELDRLEDMYIKLYNTTNENFGYNKMYGGSHGRLTDETKRKIGYKSRELWKNEEFRNKVVKGIRERASTQEWRDRVSNSVKNSEKHKEAVNSEEFRRKQSISKTEMWKNDEYRSQMSQKLSDAWTDERKARHIEYQKERSKDTSVIQAKRDVLNNIWNNSETRQKMIEGMKKEYFIINTETDEYQIFKGRKEIANHFGVSESVIQVCLYKKVLFEDKYIVSNNDIYNEDDTYITYTEYRISKRKSSEHIENSKKNKSNKMKKSYIVIDITNGLEVELRGKDAVAKHLNVTVGAISHRLKTGKLIDDKYKVVRKEDYEQKAS